MTDIFLNFEFISFDIDSSGNYFITDNVGNPLIPPKELNESDLSTMNLNPFNNSKMDESVILKAIYGDSSLEPALQQNYCYL